MHFPIDRETNQELDVFHNDGTEVQGMELPYQVQTEVPPMHDEGVGQVELVRSNG